MSFTSESGLCHRRTHLNCIGTDIDDAVANKLRAADCKFHFTCVNCNDLVKTGAYSQNIESVQQAQLQFAKEKEKLSELYQQKTNEMLSEFEKRDKIITDSIIHGAYTIERANLQC